MIPELWAIVDAHNDLLLELEYRSGEANPFREHWLSKLQLGHVALQVCPTYAADADVLPGSALQRSLQQILAFRRAIATNSETVIAVTQADDLERIERREVIGLMLAMEGLEPLGYDPSLIELFWALGVRMASLTWNRRNPFADGVTEPGLGGLSRLGENVVDRIVDLGIILDLAHASEKTFWDVLERCGNASICVSHGACRTVFDSARNLTDDQLRALADRGGVLGIMQLPFAVDASDWTIGRVIDHIDYAVSIVGVDHVGLGGDFVAQIARAVPMRPSANPLRPIGMPEDASINGLAGPEDYSYLIEALIDRGYDDKSLHAVLGGSFLRLFRSALPLGPQ